jgi:Na+-transporting methylmalonyl-CoA/oxaloacetate decarboxylase gamma subunit
MNNLMLALEITALGMGLVFAAIILLWGLMNLLTRLTADRGSSSKRDAAPADGVDADRRAQAAAVAVAIAFAEQQASHARPLDTPPAVIISAWQMGMRTRQMYQKGLPFRR